MACYEMVLRTHKYDNFVKIRGEKYQFISEGATRLNVFVCLWPIKKTNSLRVKGKFRQMRCESAASGENEQKEITNQNFAAGFVENTEEKVYW
jgi:hypothetical protein